LKHFLTNDPPLKIIDLDKEFVVCTDTCKRGIGGVLIQKGQVVCYESRKSNECNQNYMTQDLELEAIIFSLKMWTNYLLGRSFILMSDHCGPR